jgi:hypothetical protein
MEEEKEEFIFVFIFLFKLTNMAKVFVLDRYDETLG